MMEQLSINRADDVFLPYARRPRPEGYLSRMTALGGMAGENFLRRYLAEADAVQGIFDGRIPNPDQAQLDEFRREISRLPVDRDTLDQWLTELNGQAVDDCAAGLEQIASELRRAGKQESIIQNALTKMLCWLRFPMRGVIRSLKGQEAPKIFFAGAPGEQELLFLRMMRRMGADVLILQTEEKPLKYEVAQLPITGQPFPPGFRWDSLLQKTPEAPRPASPKQQPNARPAPMNYAGAGKPKQQTAAPRPPVPLVPGGQSAKAATRAESIHSIPGAQPVPQQAPIPGGQAATRTESVPAAVPPTNRPQLTIPGGVRGLGKKPGTPPVNTPAPAEPQRQYGVRGLGWEPTRNIPSQRPDSAVLESHFTPPRREARTNVWMTDADWHVIARPLADRGLDGSAFCNAFIRLSGVDDPMTYQRDLMAFAEEIKKTGRRLIIINQSLGAPTGEETGRIRRRASYRDAADMIVDLAQVALPARQPQELQREMERSFIHTMTTCAEQETELGKLTTVAVSILCYLNRQMEKDHLFDGWTTDSMPCVVHMGACRDAKEAWYLRFLAGLPVDVLILAPDLTKPCLVNAPELLELKRKSSLPETPFPVNDGTLQVQTVASHAEDEIHRMLQGEAGLHRLQQYKQAEVIILRTTFDEVGQLWKEELRYRPGFRAGEDHAVMPVLFAKFSGMPEQPKKLWQLLREMADTDQTLLVSNPPMLKSGSCDGMIKLAQRVVRDKQLLVEKLRADRQYPYGFLREDMQQHILSKLQLMISKEMIRGMHQNGRVYTCVAVALSLSEEILHLMHAFDFTRNNPKIICFNPGKDGNTLEDAILFTFLSLCGFDVLLCVPSGYQTVEQYLEGIGPVEHVLGKYQYHVTLPDLSQIGQGLWNKLFGGH